jgi:hypothetical protein
LVGRDRAGASAAALAGDVRLELGEPAVDADAVDAADRIEWDDGRTSVYTPAAGALRPAPETAKRAG